MKCLRIFTSHKHETNTLEKNPKGLKQIEPRAHFHFRSQSVRKEVGEESFRERFSHSLGSLLVLRSAEKEYQLAEGGRRKRNVCSCV